MALLNFPTNPNTGDTWVIGTTTWRWNGYAWAKFNTINIGTQTTTVTNILTINSTTNSTGTDTGALVIGGGIGVAKDINVGGTLKVLSTASSTSTDTGAITVVGGLGVGGTANIQGRITAESLRIAESVFDSTQSFTSTTDATIIDMYDVADYRGAKYLIQIDEGHNPNADFVFLEMLLLVDNDGDVWKTEYAQLSTSGSLGNFTATVAGGNLQLFFTANTATSKHITVLRTAMLK
jgi:hypothetical protein